MGEVSGEQDHQLWVNLSALGEGNIFAVLPQVMKNMLSEGMGETNEEFNDVVLPSDDAWQTKIYYKLVEKQRMADTTQKNETMLDPLMREEAVAKLHDWNIIPKPKAIDCLPRTLVKTTSSKGLPQITWTVSDIAKAGCLLATPPLNTTFEDEQEMRRVYTLIYDVYRYKNVLTQALNDVSFFQIFPKLVTSVPIIWLLLYDLYHRSFKNRDTKDAALAANLFDTVGLTYPENALWTQKVKLAAAVARLRIKHNALSLSELLPPHLKNEKVSEQAKNSPVTCWVNLRKVRDVNKLCKDIEQSFNLKMMNECKRIFRNSFKWDSHCPQIIAFHACMRAKLAKSGFVREHMLIVQDRSFCVGPATFGKLLDDLELAGSVIQTHVNSPRTTAYLATLLSQNGKVKNLMAFSAGKRKSEYESYFNDLGMTNIMIFPDRLIDTPADAFYMEEVVAVFATPPNSYSAVVDPIDLVCSRGGDLSMLEVLTEVDDTKEARVRIASVLEEQKKTLRFAMSRPQIQFVLYETHSELEAENTVMVNKALSEINKIAKLHHGSLQGKLDLSLRGEGESITSEKEINNNERLDLLDDHVSLSNKLSSELSVQLNVETESQLLDTIQVPETDLFVLPDLPPLCPSEKCKNFENEGCYLALLKRKQIIRLDDKYMIQMAENRGLFGSNTTTDTLKSKSSRSKKKKPKSSDKYRSKKKKLKDSEETIKEAQKEDLSVVSETRDNCSGTEFEPKEAKDACTAVVKSVPRNILGKLTSAHIRQFVSPFYKYKDMTACLASDEENSTTLSTLVEVTNMVPDISKKITGEINAITGDTSTISEEKEIMPKTTSKIIANRQDCIQRYQPQRALAPKNKESAPKCHKILIPSSKTIILQKKAIQPKNAFTVQKRVRNKSGSMSSNEKIAMSARKKMKIENVLARVCIPTQSCLSRMLKEAEDHKQRPRKSALEYSKRIFVCEQCRKRNMD